MSPSVTVSGLLNSRPDAMGLPLELLSGRGGLERIITSPHIQKTGLALAGFHEYLQPARVFVFGESEVRYLESLPATERMNMLAAAFSHDIPCVLITGGGTPPVELLQTAERYDVPLLRTRVATPLAIAKISAILDDALAVRQVIHGVLIDILGLGVLIIGESGIGKSECALDLIVRGHRLVADDTVEVRRRGETVVIGTCPELTRHHMELRGLGVINIRDLFGIASTRTSKRIELVVQLERWDTTREYDRLGVDENTHEIFAVKIPLIRMPVAPGRSLAILVEVAARNQLLRSKGLNAARDLVSRLEQQLRDAEADIDADEDAEHGGQV
ncbi:MAG TPA: HPr(Ser) kinase/phosphatase [Vicinamibacterales bacterium]|jgi:HPr kinase/phosphorylase|nr:HPr(Ser) kinase/phosphatase [Vicinamibacterales bacterium]